MATTERCPTHGMYSSIAYRSGGRSGCPGCSEAKATPTTSPDIEMIRKHHSTRTVSVLPMLSAYSPTELREELEVAHADCAALLSLLDTTPAVDTRTPGTIEVCEACYKNQGDTTMDDWRNCPQPKCPLKATPPRPSPDPNGPETPRRVPYPGTEGAPTDSPHDMSHMVQIDKVIADLQAIKERWGNTCVYIRRGGVSWGAVALNRQDDDKKHGLFDLQAQHDRDMEQRLGQVQRLMEDRDSAWEALRKCESALKSAAPAPTKAVTREDIKAALSRGLAEYHDQKRARSVADLQTDALLSQFHIQRLPEGK